MSNMEELWKYIEGFENRYKISNFGRVCGKLGIMSTSLNGGYPQITLVKKDMTLKTYKIHTLVAKHFLEKQEGKNEVNHKDGIKTNNRVDNLEFSTRLENIIHARDNSLTKTKLNHEKADEIRQLYASGNYTQSQIAKVYNVGVDQISRVVNFKRWKKY